LNPSRTIIDELKKLFEQSSHYLFGLLGVLGLGFISFPIFTRVFSVADYGLIDLAQKILLLVTAGAKAGMQNSALRFYNREAFQADPGAARRYYTTMLFGVGGVAVALTVAFVFSLGAFPKAIVDAPLAAVLSFASVLILARALQSILWSFLRIEERTKAYNVISVVIRGATIAAIGFFLFFMGPSAKTYYSGTMVVELTVVVAMCLPLFQRGLLNPASFDMTLFRAGFAFGAPLVVQELAGIVLDSGDRVLVRIYLGADALGLYSVAYGLASYVNTLLYAPIGMAILPIYMRLWNSEGREKTTEFLSLSLDVFLMAAAGLLAIATVVSRDAVIVLASPKYRGADTLIPTLVAGLLIYTAQIFLTAGLLIQKKTGALAVALGISAVVNILLNCLLLPKMGLQAAALATLVSYVVCTAMLSYLAFRVLPLKIELSAILEYAVAGVAAWLVGSVTELRVPVWNLLAKPTVTALVYGGAIYLLDQRVRVVAAQLWRRLRQKLQPEGVLAA
jgi:O-antigen/teichoic acid export membrane protein